MNTVLILCLAVTVAIANQPVTQKCDCDLLDPLYKSFECRSLCIRGHCITKRDCSQSPYVTNSRRDKCFFRGKYYDVGEFLPDRYPDQSGLRMCAYECRLSYIGAYFTPCFCYNQYTPFNGSCPFDTLFNPDYFNALYAPVYTTADPPFLNCPNSWAKPRPLNYTTVLCSKPEFCCHFGTQLIAKRDNVTLPGSEIHCTCMCPPLLQCIDYGKKYSW